jgi:M6 family metalloprotease-like protein
MTCLKFAHLIATSALLFAVTISACAQEGLDRSLLARDFEPSGLSMTELAEFRTVDTAITTKASQPAAARTSQPGYLGVSLNMDSGQRLVITAVATDSPAARAGIVVGDAIVSIGGQPAQTPDRLRDYLMSRVPGDELKMVISRADCTVPIATKLASISRPFQLSSQRVLLGIRLGEMRARTGGGLPIDQLTPNSPAARAGLKQGEIVVRLDNELLTDPAQLSEMLSSRKPGDAVTLGVRRTRWTGPIAAWAYPGFGTTPSPAALLFRPESHVADVRVQLASADQGRGGQPNWDDTLPAAWKKSVYRFAVILVEYPDAKHNDKLTPQDWNDAFFSTGSYKGTNRHGQRVFGSLNDYFLEQSFGKLRVEGKVFDWIEVSKKRMDYQQGTAKAPFLNEAMDKLLAREGKDGLKDFDGLLFMFAGGRVQTNRGALYWPHRASFVHQGKRWPYFIVGEGGDRMANISVFCHEFGHMLGLPDLYARPENPGSEGLGTWCAMSNQAGNGRPQHFSAWCKEQLGWIEPALIDPMVKQKLILAPIEESPKECFKVLVKPDGSEYLLLENRAKKGFDESLPADGLLIWRVVQRRPILEESHGVGGPDGPRVFFNSVPYPSAANNSFTPFTTPSSRSQLGGGLPVYITNIRKLGDGRVAFEVGYEYQ